MLQIHYTIKVMQYVSKHPFTTPIKLVIKSFKPNAARDQNISQSYNLINCTRKIQPTKKINTDLQRQS